jgi:hypothetical protein
MPTYIDLLEARKVLKDIGIRLTERQMKRAAEMDASGKRKLPFFVDPIDKKLKIEKGSLIAIYNKCQARAEENSYFGTVHDD